MSVARPTRAGVCDDRSAQGDGLRARQPKHSPQSPEEGTWTPAANFSIDIHFLAKGLDEDGSLSAGKPPLPARTYNSRSSSPRDPCDICPLSSEPAAKARGQCPAAQGAIRRGAAAMPSQPATLFSPLLCFWFVREREWELLLWLSNF